ncbi:MAG: Spy/CpxP family protein refolding chaperone [Telluria sp.]
MNTLRNSIIIGMTVLGLGLGGSTLAAKAHSGHGAQHEQMHATWGERAAKREQKLQEALKLTPAQASAWTTYAAAVKPQPRTAKGERGAWKTMPAPARMEKRIEMAKQRLTMMEGRLAATTTFYATLSAEQKKAFDDNTVHRGGHRGKRGMHG